MYSRFSLNFYQLSLYRLKLPSSVKPQFSTINHVNNISNESPKEVTSMRFPDYKVIYTFPYIKYASSLNAIKRRFTYFTGSIIPIIVGLNVADLITFDTSTSLIISGVLMTAWLHSITLICNNLVGHIYVNLEEQKVILSYANYWGQRVDFKTSLVEIIHSTDKQNDWTDPLYYKITFYSYKPKLKIFIKFGRIIDIENFRDIVGMTS